MDFSERMKKILDQGVAASKDFAVKAGAKAQELGERGLLMIEIKQLEAQAQKQIARLGNEAYKAFVEKEQKTLSAGSAQVKKILTDISKIRDSIEKKEAEIKSKKKTK